jgi:hypothetical protein
MGIGARNQRNKTTYPQLLGIQLRSAITIFVDVQGPLARIYIPIRFYSFHPSTRAKPIIVSKKYS